MDEIRKTDLPDEPALDLVSVRIADEVIASIAGIAAMDTVRRCSKP